jgi:cytochrome c1
MIQASRSRNFKLVLDLVKCLLIAHVAANAGCNSAVEKQAAQRTGGNPRRGLEAIQRYECPRCHLIPGVPGAQGRTGPSLEQIATRVHLGGTLPNTPENIIRWIKDPSGIDQLTNMPNQGVTESDARDIAAYLYTLK